MVVNRRLHVEQSSMERRGHERTVTASLRQREQVSVVANATAGEQRHVRGPGAGHSHRLEIGSTRTADASEIEHDEGAHTG